MSDDPYSEGARQVEDALLGTSGALPVELRRSVAARTRGDARELLEPAVADLADTIARHAYRTTDEQVAALVERHGEDGVLELALAAASGAARLRLDAALRALEEAP